MTRRFLVAVSAALLSSLIQTSFAQDAAPPAPGNDPESLWIEAEDLDGITGYCWPMGKPEMKKTNGHWGLSGPGWAAEWNQGGESGFLSIATGPGDDKATATKEIEIPVDGTYRVWVRYGDRREATDRFSVKIEQDGAQPWTGAYGEKAVVEEDNEAKLYWGWAFAWDQREAPLKAGKAKLSLMSTTPEPDPRQVDVIVLTTDPEYRPLIKDRPRNYAWEYLETLRAEQDASAAAAKAKPALEPLARGKAPEQAPAQWKPRTFNDKGFIYLWNVDNELKWASDDAGRVLYPYNMRDPDVLEAFEKKYAGQKDVPIFSDPRIVPTFHSVGPKILQTDAPDEKLKTASQNFVKWLEADQNRLW